jgi:2-oxoisovalerate dehydrogenase E1 component alpha subunit
MVEKVVAKFEIKYRQILDQDGNLVDKLPEFAQNPANLIELYKHMVLARIFDAKAVALQRTGKLGTYPASLGQEAISTAAASAMHANDILCPYYRDTAGYIWRGVKMEEILLYWGGSELGSNYANPAVKEDLPICVPIASQTLHAAGIALALKIRQQQRAVLTFIGDGGTSRGDFYEALNFAGVRKLPLVFVINNNHWAISVPLEQQTATATLAQKGVAANIHSEVVDGNDVIVTKLAISEAIARAHAGAGPSLIEAITYRMCDHTTADDASRYRNPDELVIEKSKDPILRLGKYLESIKQWDIDQDKEWQAAANSLVNNAVENYLNTAAQPLTSMFDFLYATLPSALKTQYDMVQSR